MNVGALLLDPLEKAAVPHLIDAIRKTAVDPALNMDASSIRVAFSIHPELGSRVVIHVDARKTQQETWDPFLFFADMPGGFGPAGFGPGVSGYLLDSLDASATAPTVWTCMMERRSGGWSLYRGFMYTAEDDDHSDDEAAFRRLASRLRITDHDLLLSKLELPDTAWCRLDEQLPSQVAQLLLSIAR